MPRFVDIIIFIAITSSLQVAQSLDASQCRTIYVSIQSLSNENSANWDGIYSLDESATSFGAPIWRLYADIDSSVSLKYIETHWVLSGRNHELLIHNASSLPTQQVSNWTHEYYPDVVAVQLSCSDSFSPTAAPSNAPTFSPTFSPTLSACDILIVSDVSESGAFFADWHYSRLSSNGFSGRPIWEYSEAGTQSTVTFDRRDGWIVSVINAAISTSYRSGSGNVFGWYPPLNAPQAFNITTNDGVPYTLMFACVATHYPTNAPTLSPTPAPTTLPSSSPTILPTVTPHGAATDPPSKSPTVAPTIAPTVSCAVLQFVPPASFVSDRDEFALNDLMVEGQTDGCDDASSLVLLGVLFDSLWLQQPATRINQRPSWRLDCSDAENAIYTVTCQQGYSGLLFFLAGSAQWQIEIHSQRNACFRRWIVGDTNSHFVPQNASWMDAQSGVAYAPFAYECVPKIGSSTAGDGDALVSSGVDSLMGQMWFWLTLVAVVLICVLFCLAGWCYRKSGKTAVVHEPNAGAMSRQDLELVQLPRPAFGTGGGVAGAGAAARDDNIAPASAAVQLQYAGARRDDGDDEEEEGDDDEEEDDEEDAPDLNIEVGEPEMVESAGAYPSGDTAAAAQLKPAHATMAAVSASDIQIEVAPDLIYDAFDHEEKADMHMDDGDDDGDDNELYGDGGDVDANDPALDILAGNGEELDPGANDDIEDLDI